MSYVQGTKINVVLEFTDSETGEPKDPDEVTVWIFTPTALAGTPPTPTVELKYSLGGVEKVAGPDGVFTFILDTAAEFGDWSYEVEGDGTNVETVVKTRTVRVKRRIATP